MRVVWGNGLEVPLVLGHVLLDLTIDYQFLVLPIYVGDAQVY